MTAPKQKKTLSILLSGMVLTPSTPSRTMPAEDQTTMPMNDTISKFDQIKGKWKVPIPANWTNEEIFDIWTYDNRDDDQYGEYTHAQFKSDKDGNHEQLWINRGRYQLNAVDSGLYTDSKYEETRIEFARLVNEFGHPICELVRTINGQRQFYLVFHKSFGSNSAIAPKLVLAYMTHDRYLPKYSGTVFTRAK